LKQPSPASPPPAAERQDEDDKGEDQGGKEAGQGEAGAGQPAASTSPEADADEASRKETSDDVWANADPKLREAHESALKAADEKAKKAENLARSNGGRLAKALTQLDALSRSLATTANADGETATSEEIEAAKRDYPELVNPLLARIEALGKQVETLGATAKASAESDVAAALSDEAALLSDAHPDFTDIVKAPEYADWLKEQPPSIQRIVQENAQAVVSAADTAMVFERFKTQTGWKSQDAALAEAAREAAEKRANQLDAGRTVSGKALTVNSSAKTGDGDYGDEWDKLDREDKRKAAGRK
jgi:hypothetical protein